METRCAHCECRATETVPELPGRVCVAHAIEYWTSLLAYVKKGRLQNAAERDKPPVMCAA